MRYVKSLFIIVLTSATTLPLLAKPVSGESLTELEPSHVRTWIFGDAAKFMYELLARSHPAETRAIGGCYVIQARGITCASRHLGLDARDPRVKYACAFQIDEDGVDPKGPAETFCVPTAGVGVGNF